MRTHHIVGVIAAGLCTIALAAGPATASTAPGRPADNAPIGSCAGVDPQTEHLYRYGGGGFTSHYGYLAMIESDVTFTYDGCAAHVLEEYFKSALTGTGELYEYQQVGSQDTVEAIPSPQGDSQWSRVTHSATFHSRYTGKTFTTDLVFTLHADGTYDVTHQGCMKS